MTEWTNTAEDGLCQWVTTGTVTTLNTLHNTSAAPFIGLFEGDPGETGSIAAEVSAAGYQRQQLTLGTTTNGSPFHEADNTNLLTFSVSAATGTITHFALCSEVTGANVIMYSPVSPSSFSISAGGSVNINIGALTMQVSDDWEDTTADAIFDWVRNGTTSSLTTRLSAAPFWALTATDPTNTGVMTDEPTAAEYSRIQPTSYGAISNGTVSNDTTDTFTFTAIPTPDTMSHFAFVISGVENTTDVLCSDALDATVQITSPTQTVDFNAGAWELVVD